MSALSTVRVASIADSNEVWRLFLQGHKENGIFSLAPDKVSWFMGRVLAPETISAGDTGPRGVIGVIGQVGSLEALVFVTIGSYWYTYDRHIEEFLVLVDPEHRRTNHAHALIQWMKDQVEITGIPLLTGVISNNRTEAKCRLYRRMVPKIGEFFYFGPKGSNTPALVAASS